MTKLVSALELKDKVIYKAYDNGNEEVGVVFRKEDNHILSRSEIADFFQKTNYPFFKLLSFRFEEVKNDDNSGWYRKEKGGYYRITGEGYINSSSWDNLNMDNYFFEVANSFSSVVKAEEIKNSEILRRQMQRFADENNTRVLDWDDWNQRKFYIEVNTSALPGYAVESTVNWRSMNEVYFSSSLIAQRCIDEIIKKNNKEVYKLKNM